MQGCTPRDNFADEIEKMKSEIEYLNEYVEKLETEIKDKDDQIERMKEEDEIFHILSNLSLEFVRGHTQGNIVSPPTFLNLYFQELQDGWKIVEFEFDV